MHGAVKSRCADVKRAAQYERQLGSVQGGATKSGTFIVYANICNNRGFIGANPCEREEKLG